jgi:cell division protein DivIC
MKTVLRVITNKYILTAFVFSVWNCFFDQNDWMTLRKKQAELTGLRADISYLRQEINTMDHERETLFSDKAKLERYARETYRMKREDEDIYVVSAK